MGEERYPEALIQSVDALARLVTADETVESTLQQIVKFAVHALDGADECSVSMSQGKRDIKTVARTADIAEKIDELQAETQEGPCLSAAKERQTFYIPDMEKDQTWPAFSKKAAEETGIQSLLAYVLRIDDDMAAMNMMSFKTDAFNEQDLQTGTIFAAQAAVTLSKALTHRKDQQKIDQLEQAIESRQVIGEAVGILMAARHIGPDDAFATLTKISQNSNMKLREVAKQLVEKADQL